jgi:hypothetical protein
MSIPTPLADQRQLLVPHPHRDYPYGLVVARDTVRGVLVRCACGDERWSTYGQATRHVLRCPTVELARWHATGQRGTSVAALVLAVAGEPWRWAEDVAERLGLSVIRTRTLLREAPGWAVTRLPGSAPYGWMVTPGESADAILHRQPWWR